MTHDTIDDPRLHDAVSADNVRRLLAGTLTDPMPGTLAAEVAAWGLFRSAQGFKAGHRFGREEVWSEVQAAAKRAVDEAAAILAMVQS